MNVETEETYIEYLVTNIVQKTMQSVQQTLNYSEWMSLKEAAKYAGVSYNTFMTFRMKGLKIAEINKVKRVSRKEVDRFLEEHSF